jgi:hypothetical protein
VKQDLEGAVAHDELLSLRKKIWRVSETVKSKVAYLLGKEKISWALVPVEDDICFDFFSHIIQTISDNSDNEYFLTAYNIVTKRHDESAESDDDDETAPLMNPHKESPNCVKVKVKVKVKEEEEEDVIDFGKDGGEYDSVGHTEPLADEVSFPVNHEDEDYEVTSELLDEKNQPTSNDSIAVNHEDEDYEETSELLDEKNQPTSNDSPKMMPLAKKRKSTGGDDKGNTNKTPKTKTTKSSLITPTSIGPSKLNKDAEVSDMISPTDESYCIITNEQALNLLKSKFGVQEIEGNYYLPTNDKPVATSLDSLRKDFCKNGLTESTSALSLTESINIARWVRYAHVAGVMDGQEFDPESDVGIPISNFMEAWKILCNKFGCAFTGGMYKVPFGSEKYAFGQLNEVYRHFACCGLGGLPGYDGHQNTLSMKDRLRLEIYFASPPFDALNTFERIGMEKPKRRSRNNNISYAE